MVSPWVATVVATPVPGDWVPSPVFLLWVLCGAGWQGGGPMGTGGIRGHLTSSSPPRALQLSGAGGPPHVKLTVEWDVSTKER